MEEKAEALRNFDQDECDKHKEALVAEEAAKEAAKAKKRELMKPNPPGVDEEWVNNMPDKYLKVTSAPLKWANFAQRKNRADESDGDSSDSDSDDE